MSNIKTSTQYLFIFLSLLTWNLTNAKTFNDDKCDSIKVKFTAIDSSNNNITFDLETTFTTREPFYGYSGFILTNNDGDTVAQESIKGAKNVYGFGGNYSDQRTLIANTNIELPFTGTIKLIEGHFAGNTTEVCNFVFEIPDTILFSNEIKTTSKKLLKITDVFGNEVRKQFNTTQLYHYNDGTVEKTIIIQ